MKRILSAILALTVAFSITACKGKPAEGGETAKPEVTATATATVQPTEEASEAPEESEAPEGDVEAKINEYLELIAPQMEELKQSLSTQDMLTLDYFAEGKSIVLQYKFTKPTEADPDSIVKSLDAMGETYKNMYAQLRSFAGSDEVSIILRYVNSDGSTIVDYVVDKDYDPESSNIVAPEPDSYASVGEFIESDYFSSMIESASSPTVAASAKMEGEDTLVFIYTVLSELDEAQRDELKTTWLDSMSASVKDINDVFMSAIDLYVSGNIDNLKIIHRLVDNGGEFITEYGNDAN